MRGEVAERLVRAHCVAESFPVGEFADDFFVASLRAGIFVCALRVNIPTLSRQNAGEIRMGHPVSSERRFGRRHGGFDSAIERYVVNSFAHRIGNEVLLNLL